ncbi:hypothetical protein AX16_008732 [Volvariella volvacea WC 439]|nr:hypothetical protein AX16_008732 [Volvariella volvacea WC 439]
MTEIKAQPRASAEASAQSLQRALSGRAQGAVPLTRNLLDDLTYAQQAEDGWEDIPDPTETASVASSATGPRKPLRNRLTSGLHGSQLRARRNVRLGKRIASSSASSSTAGTSNFVHVNTPIKVETDEESVLGRGEDRKGRIIRGTVSLFWRAVAYFTEIMDMAFRLLKKPLGLILSLFLLSHLLIRVRRPVTIALNPVCRLPFVSRLEICYFVTSLHAGIGSHAGPIPTDGKPKLLRADFPALTDVQTKSLDQLLEDSAESTGLSLEIKKAEVATTDLIVVVEHSKLRSKDKLAEMLKDFVKDAKKTGQGLQRFNAKVGGAVDQILVINDHALRTIEAAQATLPKPGSVAALMPWSPKPSDIDARITNTFADAMNIVSGELTRLILEAQVSLTNLNSLDESLNALHTLLKQEGVIQTARKDDILADIWTFFGGNRAQLREIDVNHVLLGEVGRYRDQAKAHVVGALHTLGEMAQGIEELRARVAAPRLLANLKASRGLQSDVTDIPVHLHIKSIQMGLERLKEGKNRAKMLQEAVVRKVLEGKLNDSLRG